MKPEFTAEYNPLDRRPDEPIKVGRGQSQARISIIEANVLIVQLKKAVQLAQLTTYQQE